MCLAITLVVTVAGLSRGLEPSLEFLADALVGATAGLATARWLVPYTWSQRRLWLTATVIAAAVTLPVSAFIVFCRTVIDHVRLGPGLAFQISPSVFITALVMTGLAMLLRVRTSAQTHAAPDGPPAKFLERLPAKLKGAKLYAVEAEDHYLRLHTSLGQDLILMRLSDAISELEGLEGAQTHRSWWVAKDAVQDVERADGRATLTLRDGAEVPVSRGFARELRAAGWF
jgi:DNA-binding LytR/AlgR family response regulator